MVPCTAHAKKVISTHHPLCAFLRLLVKVSLATIRYIEGYVDSHRIPRIFSVFTGIKEEISNELVAYNHCIGR
jgi:hypothetical protein